MADNWKNENKKREEAMDQALEVLLEKYKSDEVDENERIIDYHKTGFGLGEEKDGKIDVTLGYVVTPYLENSSKWNSNYSYTSFATLNNIDGEYSVESVRELPRGYDEFMDRYEEYLKSNDSESKETIVVNAENLNFENVNIIQNINFGIIGLCLVIFTFCAIFLFKNIKKLF